MTLQLFGRIPMREGPKRAPRKAHKVHSMHVISFCSLCDAPLLRGCRFKNSRGTGFCIYTEKIEAHHRCRV